MTKYDPIIANLIEQIREDIAESPTFADAHKAAVATIRRLENAMQVAINDRGCDLSLPNLGSAEIRIHGLRVRGSDPARKLERLSRHDHHSSAALILDETGELRLVEVHGGGSDLRVGNRAIEDQELLVEDLVGVVRAIRSALERNLKLAARIRWAQRLMDLVNGMIDGEELVA